MSRYTPAAFIFLLSLLPCLAAEVVSRPTVGVDWPDPTREAKPWSYWWWPGSAVDATNITRELERFAAAGYGGVHVVPIYGAKATNPPPIDYLSDAWLELLRHAVREGERLDLGVDMSLGTGWCFGGPNISSNLAGLYLDPKTLKPKQTGIKVKRAAPGGEGPMLNPIYGDAMAHYLERFTEAFAKFGDTKPRAVYHDSYEYAKANFSPDFFAEFQKRRGYDLEPELKGLFSNTDTGRAAKVRCDYNTTVSDLIVEKVMPKWIEWARARGMKTRYQAHGSPANWLDLYALADVPETEMFHTDRDILISKFASSAAHVTGKKLVAAETGTWLEEHFTETLGDMKRLVDQLFLSGVNHVVYHGACYSPDEVAWPGWLFYASTEMNSRNAIWRDLPALNAYIARCQSLLQAGEPDNDLLLYWPIHDFWSHTKDLAPMMTVHKREWFYDEEIGKVATALLESGHTFDYVSDRQLPAFHPYKRMLLRKDQSPYAAVVVPPCRGMPAASRALLEAWRKDGVPVVFMDELKGAPLAEVLARDRIEPEPLKKIAALDFITRRDALDVRYFIVNQTDKPFRGEVELLASSRFLRVFDPMTGGISVQSNPTAAKGGPSRVQLAIEPRHSVFVSAVSVGELVTNASTVKPSAAIRLPGSWQVEFVSGGPEVPAAYTTDKLASWTERGGAAESFAGAARYTLTFDATAGMPSLHAWQLDLGEVHESARVKVNGKDFGTLIMAPYRVVVDHLKPTGNVLEVEVTNLSANRVRDLDRRKVDWKVMKDINLVNLGYKPFNASDWPLRASGLLGPVTMAPVSSDGKN